MLDIDKHIIDQLNNCKKTKQVEANLVKNSYNNKIFIVSPFNIQRMNKMHYIFN